MHRADHPHLEHRLLTERHLWLTPRRTEHQPALPAVPVWFVWHEQAAWCCAPGGSARSRLLAGIPPPSVALAGRGEGAFTGEATFRLQPPPYPASVLQAFNSKFGWNLKGQLPEQGLCHHFELWRLSLPAPPSTTMRAPSMVVPPPADVFAPS